MKTKQVGRAATFFTCAAIAPLLLALEVGAAPNQFTSTAKGFEWRSGQEWIRFDKGRWSAGAEGGGSISWYMFLWHDRYVYETLPGGVVQSGPTLTADGALEMSGQFSARENSAPMKYSYRIQPQADGVHVRCELQKSGPLVLTDGIWMHITGDKKTLHGTERVWLEPGCFGTLAANLNGVGNRFHFELRPGRAVSLGGASFHEGSSENVQNFLYRYKLVHGDFQPGEKIVLEYIIQFGELPAMFPGQIKPMARPLQLGRVTANALQLPVYEKLELTVEAAATFENPFDPEQVRLDAQFTAPSGKKFDVPGFFMVEHTRRVEPGLEHLAPQGNGVWKVRFAPSETGRYAWKLTLQDRSGKISSDAGAFEAMPARTAGFVRRSSADPHYLAFDNGQGFFPIGHNLPIFHAMGQTGDEAMGKFAAAKENYNRWWMSSEGFGLEWMEHLGWYRQDAAFRLDAMLDLAREKKLYYMLCLDTHQDFREKGWLRNPFNLKNGGPCATPADWFTHAAAKDLYKKRLRYIVARWGYSPNILCWEFGNEIEGWDKSPDAIKLPWTKEMAVVLHGLDPFRHLVTTSFWSNTGPEDYWRLDELDLVQTHLYTGNDAGVAEQVRECCERQHERFAKPHIFGEFGIRAGAGTAEKDPQGWAIHNGLWAGLFSGAAGGPMPWWHESYLDKLDLYFHFTALANFAAGLPLGSARWEQTRISPLEYADKKHPAELRDVILAPQASAWNKPEAHGPFEIKADGSLAGTRKPSSLLHGDGHRDLRDPPTFAIAYPRAGTFVVRVGKVSRAGQLRIWVDDRLALDRALPCASGLGRESAFVQRWNLWETTYDQDFSVEIPAGAHRIRVDNAGKDWVTINRFVFTGCQQLDRPNAFVWGLTTKDQTILWLQNRESTWVNHAGGGKLAGIAPFHFTVMGLPDGRYRLQWWETWKGSPLREEIAEARQGQLTIAVPALPTDCALKIQPQR